MEFSVLIPARDAAATLPAALRSVARQTDGRWECVVVDDGSRDATAAVVRNAASADPRVRLVETPRTGLVAALNAGLDACRGRIVVRLDADDWMHRRRLEEQGRRFVERPDLAALGTHVRCFPRHRLGEGMRAYERWINHLRDEQTVRRDAFIECPVAHPTLAIRRECLAEYRYRDEGWPEDWDLILRLLEDGRQVGVLPRRRVAWRRGPDNLSQRDPRYSVEAFTRCRAHFLARGFLTAPTYLLWGYGATGRGLRAALAAEGREPAGIVELHPGRIGNLIHGAPVFPPEELPRHAGPPIVVSVAGQENRTLVRRALVSMGFSELVDFVCAA